MTDTAEDGNYLVRVRAQVMSRDDSSGGWVPMGGGGLSNVSVRRRARPVPAGISTGTGGEPPPTGSAPPPKQKHDYLILGQRISDECPVLRCTIKKDFEYNKVMPTFHHWKTEDKRFGLTFQTAADARAFDKGVRTAVEELLDGFTDTYPPSALQYKCQKDPGDDDVFMTLNLPQPLNSRSSSDSSGKGSEHMHQIHYTNDRQHTYDPLKGEKVENYSYVQLTAVHDYTYPVVEEQKGQPLTGSSAAAAALCRRDSSSSLKKPSPLGLQPLEQQQPALPFKVGGGKGQRVRLRCRHCQELYLADHNPKGACEYAPDRVKRALDLVTCVGVAECVSYHCAADAEGDVVHGPCDCSDDNCWRRWMCLAVLGVFMPCLWLYPPLKLCHWCGVRCGVCGGRHHVIQN